MHTIIRIDMDNAAFDEIPNWELGRILRVLAKQVEDQLQLAPGYNQTIRDLNGNAVGFCQVKE